MTAATFNAVLKTADGKVLEYGKASIDTPLRKLDFISSFVPLLRRDEKVIVDRVFGSVSVQSFKGKVHISSGSLLRIDIDEGEELTIDENLVNINENMPAKVKFYSLLENDGYANRFTDCTVYSISFDKLKLSTVAIFNVGQRLTVKIDTPVMLGNIDVEIEKIIALENGVNCFICKIFNITQEGVLNMQQFAKELNRKI